jgi:hypothetical protein
MRERVIAPIILILTLRGPRRQAGPVIPNSGDVRGCMRVGLLSVTGFPVSLSSAGQSSRASCRPHGVAKALPACCGRRPCPQMRASIRRQLTARAARNTRTPEVPARCGRAKRRNPRSEPPPRSLAGPGRTCRRVLECSSLAVVRTAPDKPPGMLVVRGAGAGCAGGRIRCLLGRPERASSRCRSGRHRRVWRRERAAAPVRRPGRGRWR